MFAFDETFTYGYGNESFASYPITKPNIRTGEGRMKYRPWSAYKQKDKKKKVRRKLAKKSKRMNRR